MSDIYILKVSKYSKGVVGVGCHESLIIFIKRVKEELEGLDELEGLESLLFYRKG